MRMIALAENIGILVL